MNWTRPRNLTAPTPKSGQIGQETGKVANKSVLKFKSSILTLFGEAICLFSDPQYELDFHQKILATTNKESLKGKVRENKMPSSTLLETENTSSPFSLFNKDKTVRKITCDRNQAFKMHHKLWFRSTLTLEYLEKKLQLPPTKHIPVKIFQVVTDHREWRRFMKTKQVSLLSVI